MRNLKLATMKITKMLNKNDTEKQKVSCENQNEKRKTIMSFVAGKAAEEKPLNCSNTNLTTEIPKGYRI